MDIWRNKELRRRVGVREQMTHSVSGSFELVATCGALSGER